MRVEYYVCDRCKNKIDRDVDARRISSTRAVEYIDKFAKDWDTILCEKCESDTINFLNIKRFYGLVTGE